MLTRFADLLRENQGRSAAQQRAAAERFPAVVERSPFRAWKPDDPRTTPSTRILVGLAASYSLNDLEWLDNLAAKAEAGAGDSPEIEVFDTLSCRSHEDFAQFIPGLGPVYQTPVVGVWENGILVENGTGAEARAIVARRLANEPSEPLVDATQSQSFQPIRGCS